MIVQKNRDFQDTYNVKRPEKWLRKNVLFVQVCVRACERRAPKVEKMNHLESETRGEILS